METHILNLKKASSKGDYSGAEIEEIAKFFEKGEYCELIHTLGDEEIIKILTKCKKIKGETAYNFLNYYRRNHLSPLNFLFYIKIEPGLKSAIRAASALKNIPIIDELLYNIDDEEDEDEGTISVNLEYENEILRNRIIELEREIRELKGQDTKKEKKADSEIKTIFEACSEQVFASVKRIYHEDKNCIDFLNSEGQIPLHVACSYGFIDAVRFLIDKGSDMNMRDKEGCTPFYTTCQYGRTEVAILLLKSGADYKTGNLDGITPISCACQRGFYDIVKLLHEKNADFEEPDNEGKTPLIRACNGGHPEVVKLLCDYKVAINSSDRQQVTPFIMACLYGHLDVIKVLCQYNPKYDMKNADGRNGLMIAVVENYAQVVEYLCRKYKDLVNERDSLGRTALMFAVLNNSPSMVNLLCSNGADASICDNDGDSPMMIAVMKDQIELIKELGSFKANSDSLNEKKFTPLILASNTNKLEVVKALLEYTDVDPDLADPNGNTPLIHAILNHHTDVVRALTQKCDVNKKNSTGITPLMAASQRGFADIVKLLIANKANLELTDTDGWTALRFATHTEYAECVKILCEGGADVDHADNDGNRPIEYSCQKGSLEIIKILIDNKAKITNQMMLNAMLNDNVEVTKLLVEGGGDPEHAEEGYMSTVQNAAIVGCAGVLGYLAGNKLVELNCSPPLLYLASQKGHLEACKALVAAGADPNVKFNGMTAAEVAGSDSLKEFFSSL